MSTPTKRPADGSSQESPSTPKRKYYASPSSNNSQTPTSSQDEKFDLYGYITQVTDLIKGMSSGNKYFDVRLKTSPSNQEIIRIMLRSNATVRRENFVNRLHKSIRLGNVSKPSGGDVYFYNSYRGSFYEDASVSFNIDDYHVHSLDDINKATCEYFNVKAKFKWSAAELLKEKKDGTKERLREGDVVFQNGTNFPISVWGTLIDSIVDNKVLLFTRLQIKHYYGVKKLSTTKYSSIIATEDEFHVDMDAVKSIDWIKLEEDEKKKSFPTIESAVLIGCDIDIYPKCTKKKCNKKVYPPKDETRFSCPHCGRRLDSSTLDIGFEGNLEMENNIELTFDNAVLSPLLGENFLVEFLHRKEELEDKILDFSRQIAITYSVSRKHITSMVLEGESEE